jgi:hypothetical protein
MANVAARLDRVLRTAGIAIVGVSIGDDGDRRTWKTSPVTLQIEAQPHIDAFDPDDPAHETAELDAAVKASVDAERLISAVVWTIIDTFAAPATVAKYQAARTKIINAYKLRPWQA